MSIVSRIILPVFLLIFVSPGFSQEIGKRFSVSANYSYSLNRVFGTSFHNGGMSIGYNVNNYIKPFIGADYYKADYNYSPYGKPTFNKVDLHIGLEGRFFKTKTVNLVLQTKFGGDVYSNASGNPVKSLRIQDKLYDPFDDMNGKSSDGIYHRSLFWSSSVFISVYYKSFEVKLGPGYQLGVFKYKNAGKQLVNSYSGTISLTYYF